MASRRGTRARVAPARAAVTAAPARLDEPPEIDLTRTGLVTKLRLLILEDNPDDAELETHAVLAACAEPPELRVVATEKDFVEQLDAMRPNVILADYSLPGFSGEKALRIARQRCPDVPLIFVSGTLGEERAVELLKQGACDYVLKDRLGRLGPAVTRALEESIDAAERSRLAAEREAAVQALTRSEERYRTIVETASEGIWLLDEQGRTTFANRQLAEMFGTDIDRMMGRRFAEFLREPPGGAEPIPRQRGLAEPREFEFVREDGSAFWALVETSPMAGPAGTVVGTVAMLTDITERHQAGEALWRANRALRVLSAGNEALIRSADEADLLDQMCAIVADESGYPLAWIAAAERPAEGLRVVAAHGVVEDALANALAAAPGAADAPPATAGPVRTAIDTGRTRTVNDVALLDESVPWRSLALARGYLALLAIPFGAPSAPPRALVIHAERAEDFTEQSVAIFEELARDLGFGLASLRAREERDQFGQRLQAALESAVKAVGATTEVRDQYTAGHQRRVAALARAMGDELGLDADTVTGIDIASSIHDIGKIAVPAEILARPSKLNDAEIALIRIHPQAGRDIIANIDFPWPVAEMILQHHERLDGSGYPAGLRGDDILFGARVIAVADVVEAMSSHRPYRPALGTDAALEEVETHRGTLYDAPAVDVCVGLIRSGRFAFS